MFSVQKNVYEGGLEIGLNAKYDSCNAPILRYISFELPNLSRLSNRKL